MIESGPARLQRPRSGGLRLEVTIEEHVAYDRSVLWTLHDGYFAKRGAPAWTGREIPSFATGNYAFARQHARFLIATVAELEASGALGPKSEVHLLEIGCGPGSFAAKLFRALEIGTGEAGRALLPRLRYVLSDYSRKTVEDALAQPDLARLATAGSLVPATFDVTKPGELLGLDGQKLAPRLTLVVANYVCCVSRAQLVRKVPAGYREGQVQVTAEVPDLLSATPVDFVRRVVTQDALMPGLLKDALKTNLRWEPAELATLAGNPLHEATIRDVLEPFATATLVYPRAFLDLLVALRPRVVPGGVALVSDFGSGLRSTLEGEADATPVHYGNTLNHPVSFAVFDAFCPHAGLDMVRTKDPFSSLFTVAVRYATKPSAANARAFRKIYVRSSEGQELTELRAAANALVEAKDHRGAGRLLERCLVLDPESPEILLRLGLLCLDAHWDRLALRYLRRGEALDPKHEFEFAFPIGRIHMRREQPGRALVAFRRAVKHAPTAQNYMSLGMAHEKLEEYRDAYVAFRKSLELDDKSEAARKLMTRIIEQYLPRGWAANVAKEAEDTS